MQVHYVLKLLRMKGEASAAQIRMRMKDGKGVVVKGLHFDSGVLKEALEQWVARTGKVPTADTPDEATPFKPPRSTSPMRDENVDPQALSAISRAAKEKMERRATTDAAWPRRKPAASGASQPPEPPGPSDGGDSQAVATTSGPSQSEAEATGSEASKPPLKRLRREAPPPASAAPVAPSSEPPPPHSVAGKSVKELKLLLTEVGLDFTGCVEKADLQALWERFEFFLSRPLAELRAGCAANGGPSNGAMEECARFLAAPPKSASERSGSTATPGGPSTAAPGGAAAAVPSADERMEEAALRERDAGREVQRIKGLKKERFPSGVAWGFAVLDVVARDVNSVQKGYRALMRKLHPDKVGWSSDVTRAVELIREAKDLCERGLSKQEPPCPPRCLKSTALCATPGHRKFRLQWLPPEPKPTALVRRYIVAALDPAYGRPLTITVLEPDYSEELHRFVGVDELTSYVFAEEDLQKMPRLWQQNQATVQVAAANEAGQSPWATLQLPLAIFAAQARPDPAWSAPASGPGRTAPAQAPAEPESPPAGEDVEANFDREVRKRRGGELVGWLEKQKKAQLAAWLKAHSLPFFGTKDELIERIIQAMSRKGSAKKSANKA